MKKEKHTDENFNQAIDHLGQATVEMYDFDDLIGMKRFLIKLKSYVNAQLKVR